MLQNPNPQNKIPSALAESYMYVLSKTQLCGLALKVIKGHEKYFAINLNELHNLYLMYS